MSKDPKKTVQAAGPVVYCGPTIPGVAVQFTTVLPPLADPPCLAVQGVIAPGPDVELAPDLRQLLQGDHQAAQDRVSVCSTWRPLSW